MDKPVSLLYDISVLGRGWFSDTARTGIFRATENLLLHIAQHPPGNKNKIKCIASQDNYFQCREYLNAHPHMLNHILLQGPEIQLHCDREVNRSKGFNPRRLFYKACQHLFKPLSSRAIAKIAGSTALFHSTYFPIPKILQKNKTIIKFLTVYDLIPVLYPQYFSGRKVRQVKTALHSLAPSDFAICISQSTKNDLCNLLKFDPDRAFVIPLAASGSFSPCKDLQRIHEVKKRYGIPAEQYILSVGTLEPRKNIKQLIFAFQRLLEQEKINDLNLVLVGAGSGAHGKGLEELINSHKLEKRVILTGYIPDQDLAPLYSGALVFVYPSLYEGFGLPPLEAMQCGTPVITSNTSSLPEVVGEAGVMTAPTDIDDLGDHLLKIYCSTALRQSLSAKSLEQAKKFSWPKSTAQTMAAYEQALHMKL
jgi:glycosyltransferase involved in cell wall biosynthesis